MDHVWVQEHAWMHLWWLIFPVMAMVFGLLAMWLRYQRQKHTIELLRTYAAQGKEPPAEIAKILQSNGHPRGPYREWQRAIFFGGLTLAFGFMAYSRSGGHGHDGIIFVAIVFAALTLSALFAAMMQQREHDRK